MDKTVGGPPTAADYAWNDAQNARSEVRALKRRVAQLERALKRYARETGGMAALALLHDLEGRER